jgi:hypothetical protein
MSGTAERVNKFSDDCQSLLSKAAAPSKVIAEMKKLRTWLQKHQTETLPENGKAKLLSTVEAYYLLLNKSELREQYSDAVESLVGDYLQIPEGKLLSAANKRKALGWYQSLQGSGRDDSVATCGISNSKPTQWTVEGVNEDATLLLLSVDDSELWKEDFQVVDANVFQEIKTLYESTKEGEPVTIEIGNDDSTVRIVVDESI